MAADWIPMRLDIREDPAVIMMADALKVREEVIVGYLHSVWSWLSRQCHDGSVTGVTLSSLGRVTNLHGFPELMRDAGWIIESKNAAGVPIIVVPNWDRWLSKSAKYRIRAAERQRKSRHGNVADLSRNGCDKGATTEEKRREKKKKPPKSPKGESFDPKSVELPFPSAEFRDAWSLWCDNRSENRKPMRPTGTKTQLKNLAAIGEARAIAAIEHSVANGYQGIYEPSLATTPKELPREPEPQRPKYYIAGVTNVQKGNTP